MSVKANLHQLYVAGVRFDTELQYRVVDAEGMNRWRKLPQNPPEGQDLSDGADICARQGVAMVVARPPPTWELPNSCAAIQLQQSLQVLEPGLGCVIWPVSGPVELGYKTYAVLAAGRACILRVTVRNSSRWVTVMGAEWASNAPVIRALLLLDPQGSEPWACGHNARLELLPSGESAKKAKAASLRCRHLTGEVYQLQPQSLVILSRLG